jgi:hypothetical protein
VSVSATFSGTFTGEKAISAHEYSGLEPISPLDVTAASATNSSNASSGSVRTTVPNELLFGAALLQSSGTAGAGFTQRSSIAGNVSEDKIVTVTGSYDATTVNSNQSVILLIAAFKAAGQ